MGRYSANPSTGHKCTYLGGGSWRLAWVCDRYYKGSRQRFPTVYRRVVTLRGARAFCKRWGLQMPDAETRRGQELGKAAAND